MTRLPRYLCKKRREGSEKRWDQACFWRLRLRDGIFLSYSFSSIFSSPFCSERRSILEIRSALSLRIFKYLVCAQQQAATRTMVATSHTRYRNTMLAMPMELTHACAFRARPRTASLMVAPAASVTAFVGKLNIDGLRTTLTQTSHTSCILC